MKHTHDNAKGRAPSATNDDFAALSAHRREKERERARTTHTRTARSTTPTTTPPVFRYKCVVEKTPLEMYSVREWTTKPSPLRHSYAREREREFFFSSLSTPLLTRIDGFLTYTRTLL